MYISFFFNVSFLSIIFSIGFFRKSLVFFIRVLSFSFLSFFILTLPLLIFIKFFPSMALTEIKEIVHVPNHPACDSGNSEGGN